MLQQPDAKLNKLLLGGYVCQARTQAEPISQVDETLFCTYSRNKTVKLAKVNSVLTSISVEAKTLRE